MPHHSRRRAVGTLICVLTAAVAMSGAALAADWPQYRGPGHDQHSPETGIVRGWGRQPRLVWKVPIGEGFGSFAVADGTAYIFVDRNMRETAVALDAKSGRQIWAVPLDQTISDRQGGSNPRSTPTIDGNHVYFFTVNLKLACLDRKTGKTVWLQDLKQEYNGQDLRWGNACSPVLVGDRIFVGGGGGGKSMLAFDKTTGKVLWATGNEQITHASPTPATIHGVPQIIFFMQSGLVALNQEDGRELWRHRFPFKISTAASPIVGGKNGDVVYCSAGYDVGSCGVRVQKTGDGFGATQLYFTDHGGPKGHNANHWSTPLHHAGHLYGIFGFKDYGNAKDPKAGAPVKCVDIETGQTKWAAPGFGSGGGTILVDGHIIVQGDQGVLALIEATPTGYREKGRITLPGEKFWTMAILADGKIFARSKTEAFCFEVGTK